MNFSVGEPDLLLSHIIDAGKAAMDKGYAVAGPGMINLGKQFAISLKGEF